MAFHFATAFEYLFCCVTLMSYWFSIFPRKILFFATLVCRLSKKKTAKEAKQKHNIQLRTFIDFLNLNSPLDVVAYFFIVFKPSHFHYSGRNGIEATLKFDIFFNLKTNEVHDVYRLLIKPWRNGFLVLFLKPLLSCAEIFHCIASSCI